MQAWYVRVFHSGGESEDREMGCRVWLVPLVCHSFPLKLLVLELISRRR